MRKRANLILTRSLTSPFQVVFWFLQLNALIPQKGTGGGAKNGGAAILAEKPGECITVVTIFPKSLGMDGGFTVDIGDVKAESNITGQVFVFFILAVAAAESAIGLAIIVSLFRARNSLEINLINKLKG